MLRVLDLHLSDMIKAETTVDNVRKYISILILLSIKTVHKFYFYMTSNIFLS